MMLHSLALQLIECDISNRKITSFMYICASNRFSFFYLCNNLETQEEGKKVSCKNLFGDSLKSTAGDMDELLGLCSGFFPARYG